jgi:hypothetical protein
MDKIDILNKIKSLIKEVELLAELVHHPDVEDYNEIRFCDNLWAAYDDLENARKYLEDEINLEI